MIMYVMVVVAVVGAVEVLVVAVSTLKPDSPIPGILLADGLSVPDSTQVPSDRPEWPYVFFPEMGGQWLWKFMCGVSETGPHVSTHTY